MKVHACFFDTKAKTVAEATGINWQNGTVKVPMNVTFTRRSVEGRLIVDVFMDDEKP